MLHSDFSNITTLADNDFYVLLSYFYWQFSTTLHRRLACLQLKLCQHSINYAYSKKWTWDPWLEMCALSCQLCSAANPTRRVWMPKSKAENQLQSKGFRGQMSEGWSEHVQQCFLGGGAPLRPPCAHTSVSLQSCPSAAETCRRMSEFIKKKRKDGTEMCFTAFCASVGMAPSCGYWLQHARSSSL